jgi:hypothetical protein
MNQRTNLAGTTWSNNDYGNATDIELLHEEIAKVDGRKGLGGLIECTLDPYKVAFTISTLDELCQSTPQRVCVMGDAARQLHHPNFLPRVQPCYSRCPCLGQMCSKCSPVHHRWMAEYSRHAGQRMTDCLAQRHLGREYEWRMPLLETKSNNGNQLSTRTSINIIYPLATSEQQVFEAQILEAGSPASALPLGRDFKPLWDFTTSAVADPSAEFTCVTMFMFHQQPCSFVAADHISRDKQR